MNILAVTPFNLINSSKQKKIETQKASTYCYGKSISRPAITDTISFKAVPTEKMLTSRTGGVSMATAIKINNTAITIQKEIQKFIKGLYIDFLCTQEKPRNLIRKVCGRAKTPDSIVEKSQSMQEDTLAGVFLRMTDLNGAKIVIREATRKNVHKTLDILLKAIDRGLVILEEVEVKRPKSNEKLKGTEISKRDYADPEYLADFVKKAEKTMDKKVDFPAPQYTAVNYTAIHFLLRLPGQKRVFELQLMGHNVSILKDLDDIMFKILNNKNVDKEYAPIVEILKPITLSGQEINLLKYIKIKEKLDKLKFSEDEKELLKNRFAMGKPLSISSDSPEYIAKVRSLSRSKDYKEKDLEILYDDILYEAILADTEAVKDLKRKAEQFEKFKSYRAQAFLFQRDKKTVNDGPVENEYFLPLSEDLPHEFDLNNLHKIFLKCQDKKRKAEKAQKNIKI